MTVKKMQIRHKIFHLKLLLRWNSTRVQKKVCVASHNNHSTSLASSWDTSFLKSLVHQDPKGSNKVAHLFILEVYVSPNRKSVNLSQIYYFLDFSFSCPKMTLITIFTRMAQHLHYTFLPGRASSRMFLAQCQSSEACESGSSSNHRLFVNRRPLGGKTNLSFVIGICTLAQVSFTGQ